VRLPSEEAEFGRLALALFALQFTHNAPYRRLCEAQHVSPSTLDDWREVPAMPTSAFREFEVSCLPPAQRTRVFHSSGTTGQRPSRHFHDAASLELYEASLLPWFEAHLLAGLGGATHDLDWKCALRMICLTPPPEQAPHSSLVHMFATLRRHWRAADALFAGTIEADGTWRVDFDATVAALGECGEASRPVLLPGTAFSFAHLLDHLTEAKLRFALPAGSRVMETGGYKGRSRALPKAELHARITERLGVPPSLIVCEYGMSELSSQAYDHVSGDVWQVTSGGSAPRPSPLDPRPSSCCLSLGTRHFHFPPWARVQLVSPETGRAVGEGETGLIRVFDLANVFSVMAIQTDDLGVRRGNGFELLGRAALADPRGCSLMAAS